MITGIVILAGSVGDKAGIVPPAAQGSLESVTLVLQYGDGSAVDLDGATLSGTFSPFDDPDTVYAVTGALTPSSNQTRFKGRFSWDRSALDVGLAGVFDLQIHVIIALVPLKSFVVQWEVEDSQDANAIIPPSLVGVTTEQAAYLAAAAAGGVDIGAHVAATTLVHGIPDTALLETAVGSQAKVDTHNAATTSVHGIVDTALLETAVGSQSKVDVALADSIAYMQARGMNLLANGSGFLGDNSNFSSFVFDQVETHGGSGSFKNSTPTAVVYSDEYIPVSGARHYHLSIWAKSTTFVSGNRAFLGVAPFDIDNLAVDAANYMRILNTDTTLAADLNVGDTTITLSNSANWLTSSSLAYQRQMIIFNYTNLFGYTYPDYTYSRKLTRNFSGYSVNGLWAIGGISGNVITLTEPWPASLGNVAAGTAVSNNSSGSAFKYIALVDTEITNQWTEYRGQIGGVDVDGSGNSNLFPHGTAYLKLVFLLNRSVSGNATNVSDLWFSEIAGENLSGRVSVSDTSAPDEEGEIKYVGGKHYGYDGATWNAMY